MAEAEMLSERLYKIGHDHNSLSNCKQSQQGK